MPSFKVSESEEIRHQCCEIIYQNNCSCDAYAPTNYSSSTGWQLWSKESTFNRPSGSNGQKIYIANKGKSCFPLQLLCLVLYFLNGSRLDYCCCCSCSVMLRFTSSFLILVGGMHEGKNRDLRKANVMQVSKQHLLFDRRTTTIYVMYTSKRKLVAYCLVTNNCY